jgi:3,4-dihydroxy-9,10-secoandrosta-1,3,5(10)-triene-9,17-dione 4,5-dioxygenase
MLASKHDPSSCAPADSVPTSAGSGIGPDGSVYLKMDERQWRIAIHPTHDHPGLCYMGFELGSQQELAAAVQELNQAGVRTKLGNAENAKKRAVSGIAYCADPAGNAIELFYGPTKDYKFDSPQGIDFVTGVLGLGHLNLFIADLPSAKEFYTLLLGFKLSDYINFGPELSANFYHCNSRHHTLGLTHIGPTNGLHHAMLEMQNIDQVAQCLERAEAAGITITSSLGRHTNDHMLSFYMQTPSRFEMEIGCDGLLVGKDWLPSEFCEGDVWGHKGLDPVSITAAAQKIDATESDLKPCT